MGLRHSDERLWFGFGQTLAEVFNADPRINQDRNGTRLKQGEGEREKLQRRGDHQRRFHATSDTDPLQSHRQIVALLIKLLIGVAGVLRLTIRVAGGRKPYRNLIGALLSHLFQVRRNVDDRH